MPCGVGARRPLPAFLQTFGEASKDIALPTISDKDRARIDKIRAKEESAARAAFEVRGGRGGDGTVLARVPALD